MIYLASPYSHPDEKVRQARYEAVCRATAALMREGLRVFSPIAHSHPLVKYGAPTEWRFWRSFDIEMLGMCDVFWVLTLPGWRESEGVSAEIEFAKRHMHRTGTVTEVDGKYRISWGCL